MCQISHTFTLIHIMHTALSRNLALVGRTDCFFSIHTYCLKPTRCTVQTSLLWTWKWKRIELDEGGFLYSNSMLWQKAAQSFRNPDGKRANSLRCAKHSCHRRQRWFRRCSATMSRTSKPPFFPESVWDDKKKPNFSSGNSASQVFVSPLQTTLRLTCLLP